MRVWKVERQLSAGIAPIVVFLAHRDGESMSSVGSRARKAFGTARWPLHSATSTEFYINPARGWIHGQLVEVEEPAGEAWRAFLNAELGTSRWCVAPRMTARLAEKYDRAVSQHAFNDLKALFLTKKGIPK